MEIADSRSSVSRPVERLNACQEIEGWRLAGLCHGQALGVVHFEANRLKRLKRVFSRLLERLQLGHVHSSTVPSPPPAVRPLFSLLFLSSSLGIIILYVHSLSCHFVGSMVSPTSPRVWGPRAHLENSDCEVYSKQCEALEKDLPYMAIYSLAI